MEPASRVSAGSAAGCRRGIAPHFYTMGDAGYFLGGVGLVNSLRLLGHREKITFLDLGLTPAQRDLLATECEVVQLPREEGIHPFIFQAFAHCLAPEGVVVILDSDIIVTARLDELVEAARAGRIVVFPESDRYVTRRFTEWRELFDLPLVPRVQPYVNSGFVGLAVDAHGGFLGRWWDECQRLARRDPSDEQRNVSTLADQDVLNALLMSEVAIDDIAFQDHRTSPMKPWELAHTKVLDFDGIRCSHEGVATVLLHSTDTPKPWRREAMVELREGAYVRCLRRLLTGPDLAIRLPASEVPPWLRAGVSGALALRGLQLLTMTRRVRRALVRRLGTGGRRST